MPPPPTHKTRGSSLRGGGKRDFGQGARTLKLKFGCGLNQNFSSPRKCSICGVLSQNLFNFFTIAGSGLSKSPIVQCSWSNCSQAPLPLHDLSKYGLLEIGVKSEVNPKTHRHLHSASSIRNSVCPSVFNSGFASSDKVWPTCTCVLSSGTKNHEQSHSLCYVRAKQSGLPNSKPQKQSVHCSPFLCA